MKLSLDQSGPADVIRVEEDRIDASVAVQFKDCFRALAADGTGPVVLDLGAVAFLDSSGLGAVVAARKLLGAGRALDLAGLQPAVEQVMVLTRMNTVFEIHRDVATAMEAHGSAPAA